MVDIERFTDEWGPEKILQVHDSRTRMQGILVIDNTALGPGKGGIRMTPTVDVEELFELPVEILILASVADVINEENMDKVKARVIVEAANIPVTLKSEERLRKRRTNRSRYYCECGWGDIVLC